MTYSIIKTFIYDYSYSKLENNNKKFEIFGKPKKIQICNYGVHSTVAMKKVFCEIDLGNFIPNCDKLYCHISEDNNFLIHTSLEFDADLSQYNGFFKPIIKNYYLDEIIDDEILFVIQLNLIY